MLYPRGLETPYEKCQRWSTIGPHGAAIRPTALRQSPKDVSGPKNPMQMKHKSIPNDLYSPHLCYCNHTSSKSGKMLESWTVRCSARRRPTLPTDLTPCLNQQHATQGPAEITCSLTQHLIKTSPKYQCLQALNTRQEPSARGGPLT